MHPIRDHHLPLDPAAYRNARHPRGRVIVIAPTRAACETIELGARHDVPTRCSSRNTGRMLRELGRARASRSASSPAPAPARPSSIRPIAQAILGESLRYGVVNREREATPETPSWNVVIITTGIARRWFQDDLIDARDTLIADEIHQTSAELELCLALGKRAGCRFIWLSATVDPSFYAKYLGSAEVLETSAFDPGCAPRSTVVAKDAAEFLDERFLRHVMKERARGGGVRPAPAPRSSGWRRYRGTLAAPVDAAFYHGGEPIRVIRPFLEGTVERPFLLAMTAAGQSALNIPRARHGRHLRRALTQHGRSRPQRADRTHLGANEILQMAGRVHGRVAGRARLHPLRPPARLRRAASDGPGVPARRRRRAGSAHLRRARRGADELDLPVPLDRIAYRRAVALLDSARHRRDGRLTDYGKEVEAMPVDRAMGRAPRQRRR